MFQNNKVETYKNYQGLCVTRVAFEKQALTLNADKYTYDYRISKCS